MLAARADGLGKVLGLSRRHHEDDVVRRLFQRLQQGIESGVGDLVGLVEDVDLVLVACGAVAGGVAQLADLVDAAIGGGVDLDDVDGIAGLDLGAAFADLAWLGRWPRGRADGIAAVQRHGQDARDGGLADAAVAGEDVTVGDAVLGERMHQSHSDVVLSDDVGEALGTIFASEYLVGHRVESSSIVPPGGQ